MVLLGSFGAPVARSRGTFGWTFGHLGSFEVLWRPSVNRWGAFGVLCDPLGGALPDLTITLMADKATKQN